VFLDRRPYTLDRVFRLAVTAGLVYALVRALAYLSDVLIPFAAAFLIAYLMNPLVAWLERKVRSRALAVFLSLLLVAALLGLTGGLVVPMIMGEIHHMGEILSDLVSTSELQERAREQLPEGLWQAIKDYAARPDVQAFFRSKDFLQVAQAVLQKALPGAWSVIKGAFSVVLALVGLATVGLYLVFLLLDYRRVREGWTELVPPARREQVRAFVADVNAAMSRYFRGQAAVAGCVGVLFAIGFGLIGLPMGILLGLFVGLLNMVPYLQIVGLIPAAFLAFIHGVETGSGFWAVIVQVGVVFVVVQAIQDGFLVPRIMGKVTGLSPAVILLSLSIWGKLLGLFGLLIALPATCVLLAYYRRLLAAQAEGDFAAAPEDAGRPPPAPAPTDPAHGGATK